MDLNPVELPCINCICLAICKAQHLNDLLIKCKILKSYMEIDLDHFDCALDFFNYNINGEDGIRYHEL